MAVETGDQTWGADESLDELAQLAATAGAEVIGTLIQRLEQPSPKYYLGTGKLRELVELKEQLGFDVAIFDDELTPGQQRNLERALDIKVLDRTALILDIFARRAQTHEGRLQVELAQHQYLLPRLVGQWSHLERLGGGIGTRGPGETQLETDRRQIKKHISHLKYEIERVREHRQRYRNRRRKQGLPVVALVGYTNAGKSTLFNTLTGASVEARSRLFETLDPTTRLMTLPSKRQVLLTDTVGFIHKLPPELVAAFKATLEELHDADLLVHVLDITHEHAREHNEIVLGIVAELDLADKPVVLALNKADLLFPDEHAFQLRQRQAQSWAATWPEGTAETAVLVSAAHGWGLRVLLGRIEEQLAEVMQEITVEIPYAEGNMVTLFHREGSVEEERHRVNGTVVRGRLPAHLVETFKRYRVK